MAGSRVGLIGDAAIELIAREGLRGLTHRAVDRAAGLPPGSTSYYARTRLALLELAIARMLEHDDVDTAALGDGRPEDLADAVAGFLHESITAGRARTLARYELALEAARRPELRAAYDRAGGRLRERAAALLRAAGSVEPDRHARLLVAWCEGVLFEAIAGAGTATPPGRAELVTGTRDLLRTLLPT